MCKENILYNLQILQTDIREKNLVKKERSKTHVLLENNQAARMSRKTKHRQNCLSENVIKCSLHEIEQILWK